MTLLRWREDLGRLGREWTDLTHRQPAVRVDHWLARLRVMEAHVNSEIGNGTWRTGPSDTLGVLRRDRDELVHSRMLAWLLDPLGQHGLGCDLIRALAAAAGSNVSIESRRAIVRTEVTRPLSRADILVELPELGIVIENKVDATEGDRQCRRLADDYPDHLLVFLTPSGRRPMTAGDQAERWRPMSWTTVTRLLGDLLPQASGAGCQAVKEYHDTLRRVFR